MSPFPFTANIYRRFEDGMTKGQCGSVVNNLGKKSQLLGFEARNTRYLTFRVLLLIY
jgi:hypothetical protein